MTRNAMHFPRAFLARHRAFAAMLIAAALCMKALIPAGYMLGSGERVLTVEICADSQGGHLTKQIVIPGGGKSGGGQSEHDKVDGTCPFSALSFASVSGADPDLLTIALIFIMALGFVPVSVARATGQSHLRPPLRGPPALA